MRIDESDIYTMELSKNNSFPRLFQLLTEEILYRYWEENINDDKVECNFDDVYYNYDEIASRYADAPAARLDFIKYVSTSRETLRNIEVDKCNILEMQHLFTISTIRWNQSTGLL